MLFKSFKKLYVKIGAFILLEKVILSNLLYNIYILTINSVIKKLYVATLKFYFKGISANRKAQIK